MAPKKMSFVRRFLSKVQRSGDCWMWTAARLASGYGKFGVDVGVWVLAHRASYEAFVGPIPAGMQIDHLCRNRACVNPAHMEVVTPQTNTRRGSGCADSPYYVPHLHTEETKQKLRAHRPSAERIALLQEAFKRWRVSGGTYTHTPETRAILSERNKGKKFSDETRQKMRDAWVRRKALAA